MEQRYGTDALNAICKVGFGELRLERIWLEVYAQRARPPKLCFSAGRQPPRQRQGWSRGRIDQVDAKPRILVEANVARFPVNTTLLVGLWPWRQVHILTMLNPCTINMPCLCLILVNGKKQ